MKWIQEELDVLTKLYGQIPASYIAERLSDRTIVAIHKKARKLGLRSDRIKMTSIAKKRYWCNEQYFVSGSLDVCYWAGFVAADGCVTRNNNCLKVELGLKDSKQVYKLRNVLEFSGPISIGHSCVLRLYGVSTILDDLENRFSVTERKSMTLQPPRLSCENDVRAFIRGFFDGDGSIAKISKGNSWRASITCGSYDFLQWVLGRVQTYLIGIKCAVYKDRNCYQLVFAGSRQSLRFLEWLYKDSTQDTRLDRKYSLFLKLAKRCDEIDQYQASVYRGVCFDPVRQKWTSHIYVDGKKKYLGRFDTERDAALVYNCKAQELGLEERCYAVRDF